MVWHFDSCLRLPRKSTKISVPWKWLLSYIGTWILVCIFSQLIPTHFVNFCMLFFVVVQSIFLNSVEHPGSFKLVFFYPYTCTSSYQCLCVQTKLKVNTYMCHQKWMVVWCIQFTEITPAWHLRHYNLHKRWNIKLFTTVVFQLTPVNVTTNVNNLVPSLELPVVW